MTTPRIVIGKFVGGGYGVRVAEIGYDVNTNPASDANYDEHMHFNSDWPTLLPIYQKGSISVTANAGLVTTSFTALGYIPFFVYALSPGTTPGTVTPRYNVGTIYSYPMPNYYVNQSVNNTPYVRVAIRNGTIDARYEAADSGGTIRFNGWPSSFTIYYVIFWQRAQ